MTKSEFLEKVVEKSGLEKAVVEQTLSTFIEIVIETLQKEERFALVNFGTFVVNERKERQGRNPRTGDPLTIPACKVVRFNPGKQLKDAIQGSKTEEKEDDKEEQED